ncbi:MAG TPA: hypothetical protein VGE22_05180 [Solimonas sp.]
MDAVPSYDELRQLADAKGLAIATAFRIDGDGTGQVDVVFNEFADRYQPFLADKPYTALFRTYKNWVLVAIQNALEPGSAVAEPPVKVSSIADGQAIHRRNRLSMSADLWSEYTSELQNLATVRANELLRAVRNGEDAESLMHLHNLEMAQLGLDYGLTEDEDRRDCEIFSRTYTAVLEAAARGGLA